jgi:ABC-type multidrug transport system fused ATPase/permease subunit
MNPADKILLRDLARTLGTGLLQPIIPRLLLMGFSFAQPFFIQRLIRYLQGGDGVAVYLERNLGYGLIGASFFIYLGIALSTAMYWYLHFRTIMKLRATLATAIFAKTRQVSSHTLDDSVLTLMSTDVSRVVGGIQNVHELWANTIEVALAAWLLERQIGAAFVAPIFVVLICIACTTVVAKGAASRQGEWTKKTQNRVSVTSSVIGHIKAILISGRAEHLESMVQRLRDDELRSGSRFRVLMVFSTCVAFAPMLVSPLMTFAVTARSLDTAQVYASLAYLTLLASPLTQLFQTLPNMLASKASLERIQTFLAAPPRVDYRVVLCTEKSSSEKSEHSGRGPTISFHDVSLGWEEAKWQLSHLNMAIPSSELTIIRGSVASGKSTLSRALLGEVPFVEGKVEFSSAYGKIGFCAQTPFLTNGTIRSNIVGMELFDSSRYESVLHATLLKLDIDSLPERDETRVGSGGLTLSGGQKQRVALARALYLESDLYIIDNALSGLDKQTADDIVHRVFGPTGLLREKKATVVWCTESTEYLSLAHKLIVLGANNTLEYCGPPEEDSKHYVAPSAAEIEVFSNTTPSVKQTPPTKPKEASNAHHDSGVYSHYRSAIGTSVTAAVLLFGCLFSFAYNFGTVWLNFWAEDVFKRPTWQSLPFYLGIYSLIQISGLISLGMYVGSTNMVMFTRGGSHLHMRAIRSLFSMPLGYFAETDRGASINLFSQDMALVDGPLSFAISNTLLSGFTALGQAVVVAVATPWVAIGYPVLLGVLYLLQRYYLKTSRQLRLLDLESKSPL